MRPQDLIAIKRDRGQMPAEAIAEFNVAAEIEGRSRRTTSRASRSTR